MTVNVTLTLVDKEGEVEPFQGEVQESSECEETLHKLAEAGAELQIETRELLVKEQERTAHLS